MTAPSSSRPSWLNTERLLCGIGALLLVLLLQSLLPRTPPQLHIVQLPPQPQPAAAQQQAVAVDVCASVVAAQPPPSLQCLPAENVLDLAPLNELGQARRCHHPVFRRLVDAGLTYPLERNMVREETGLLVPFHYDCEKWRKSGFPYYQAVPSRYLRCAEQKALWALNLPNVTVKLPVVDEEYHEMVAIYQSVLMAKGAFHMVEMGARWGTWGARASTLLRKLNPMPYSLLYYEPEAAADGLEVVHQLNGIASYELVRGFATTQSFNTWAARVPHIDVLDMDVQKAEAKLLPEMMPTVNAKVKRLIVGTHADHIHTRIRNLIVENGWSIQYEVERNPNTTCLAEHFARGTRRFDQVLALACYHNSTMGPIANWDGEVIADNPRFAIDRAHPSYRTKCLLAG